MANLYSVGAKLLFMSGYRMAREEFLEQTNATDCIVIKQKSDIELATNKRVIFLTRDRYDLFVYLTKALPDLAERIVFIKNVELYDDKFLSITKDLTKLVIAGDIDNYSHADKLLNKKWQSKILFSKPSRDIGFQLPELPKYAGYLKSDKVNGVISIVNS